MRTKDWILKKMGIEANNYHKLQDQSNLVDHDMKEMTILEKSFKNHSKL